MKSMIRLLALTMFITGVAHAADTYKFDPVHTQVTFFVNHLGFTNSSGRFHVSESALQFDEKDWTRASVEVTIQVSSLDMGDATWKDHVSDPRFLDVQKFPTMTFKSTKVEAVGKDQLKVTGDLTLHGVTKSVVLDTHVNKVGPQPFPPRRPSAGFSATTRIKRSEFGMTQMIPMIGDDVDIRIEAEGSVPAGT